MPPSLTTATWLGSQLPDDGLIEESALSSTLRAEAPGGPTLSRDGSFRHDVDLPPSAFPVPASRR